jgi:hypothetical protein
VLGIVDVFACAVWWSLRVMDIGMYVQTLTTSYNDIERAGA